MRYPLNLIYIALCMLLVACGNDNEGITGEFTIIGKVIEVPSNSPISNVLVQVKNDNYVISTTKSDSNGAFKVTIDKSQLDDSYYLSLFDMNTNITKRVEIKGIGLSNYDFGNIVMYEVATVFGSVVSEPNNAPIEGVSILISNGSGKISSTKTSSTGSFSIGIIKSLIDESSVLQIHDKVLDISKSINFPTFEGLEYKIGNIVLYDRRNPYNLPTAEHGGFTYVMHSVLKEKMTYDEAKQACESLGDYGISNWYLPSMEELELVFGAFQSKGVFPVGKYWTSTFDYEYNKYMVLDKTISHSGWEVWYISDPDSKLYVVPISRY